ncbi:hypothetical protein MKY04_10410 [Lysinibacillus telephonicus]|uniref:hypothetical protein n=1 Tax=Lysinibacillus telephonicus TaxID=1714840 RepID=UPI0031FDE279
MRCRENSKNIGWQHSVFFIAILCIFILQNTEVKYINDQIPENHYKIYVRSKKYKIEFDDKYVLKVYKLNNGNDALYMEPNFPFKMLAFENGNWQYVLHIDNRVDEVTPEILVQIANSINYDTEN